MKKLNDNEQVEKIILKLKDGTIREISKGVIIENKSLENGESTLIFNFCNVPGHDLGNLIFGVMQLGVEMGLFDGIDEE